MAAMVKQYGKQKGKEVFYASKNKGTIEGVEETKMNYIDKVLSLDEERKVEVERNGRTRTVRGQRATNLAKAMIRRERKGRASRGETWGHKDDSFESLDKKGMYTGTSVRVVPQNEAYTVYQHIGILMAEALGFVTEGIPPHSSGAKRHAPRRDGENTGTTPPPDPNAPTRRVEGTPFTTTDLTPEQKEEMRRQSRRNAAARTERERRKKLAQQGPPPASDALRR